MSKFERTVQLSPQEIALNTFMNARVPVMLVGSPGTAKTATINALAEEMGYKIVTVILSRMDPQDISGFPTRGTISYEENGKTVTKPVTEYAPQHWQHYIMQHRRVVLFFDEWSNAHPSVQASMLSFVQDRQFPNGEMLPDETIIVGAMNPTDSAADGYELSLATTNRISFIAWKPNDEAWFEGMITRWGKCDNEDELYWRSMIVNFLKANPGSIHMEPSDNHGSAGVYGVNLNDSSEVTVMNSAWASRRSWDNLAVILGTFGKFDNLVMVTDEKTDNSKKNEQASASAQANSIFGTLCAGTVGVTAAYEFQRWVHETLAISSREVIEAFAFNPDNEPDAEIRKKMSAKLKENKKKIRNLPVDRLVDLAARCHEQVENNLELFDGIIGFYNFCCDEGLGHKIAGIINTSLPLAAKLNKKIPNDELFKANKEKMFAIVTKISNVVDNSRTRLSRPKTVKRSEISGTKVVAI